MTDDKKYWLNEFGLRRWKHKTLPYELQRDFHWVDRVSFLKNSEPGGGRPYLNDFRFTTLEELSITDSNGTINLELDDFEILQIYERRKKLERILTTKKKR